MNIAVGFFGIHYKEDYKHWMGWDIFVDWKKSLVNYSQNLLLKEYSYDFYTSTYFTKKINELNGDYNFEKIQINNFVSDKNSHIHRNTRFIETLNLIQQSDKNYDFVMMTRFDLSFFNKPLETNINYEKMNVLNKTKWGDNHNLIDDNWYFFPYSKLQVIIEKLKNNFTIHSHSWNDLIDVHTVDSNSYFSHENPYYKIVR